MARKWYCVSVAPGQDEAARSAILKRAKIDGFHPKLVRKVLMPTYVAETASEDGTLVERTLPMYAGYLVIDADLDDPDVFHMVRDIRHVNGFLSADLRRDGDGKEVNGPVALTPAEAEMLLKLDKDEKTRKVRIRKWDIPYSVGDRVLVTSGTWAQSRGEVLDIDEPTPGGYPVVTVRVTILGKPVSVQLDHFNLKPL